MSLGAIQVARKTIESEIWAKKPSWWFKVWCFILMHVNHKSNNLFDRGSNFFTYSAIYDDCCLTNDKVKKATIDNVIRWLRKNKMVTTTKTTRGIVITVCNYDTYQDLSNYKNDKVNERQTRDKRETNETINNNGNNDNNDNNEKNKEIIEEILRIYGEIKPPSKDKSRSRAKVHLERLVKTIDPELLLSSVKNYRKDCQYQGTEPQYIKSSGNFFGRDIVYEDFMPENYVSANEDGLTKEQIAQFEKEGII